MQRFRLHLILSILFLFSLSLHADTIRLRNGTTLEGTIIAQTRTAITVRSDRGIQTVAKSQIASIKYGPVKPKKTPAQLAREKAAKEAAEKRRREKQRELAKKLEEERRRKREAEERRRKEIAAIKGWLNPKTDFVQQQFDTLIKQEKSTGMVTLYSNQKFDIEVLEDRGEAFFVKSEDRTFTLRKEEIEEMEITLNLTGNGKKKTISADEMVATNQINLKPGQVRLVGGTQLDYTDVSFDGYNYYLETDSAGKVRVNPADIYEKPPNRESGDNDFPEILSGLYLKPGQYGYLMTYSGQKIEGKMLIRATHEILMETNSGLVSVSPTEVVYGRDDPSVKSEPLWQKFLNLFQWF